MIKILTLEDINKAIIDQVTEGLKDSNFKNIEFSSTDIEEEIIRPSFYVGFENNKTGLFNKHNKERNLEVNLYYFAKQRENSKLELLEIQDLLENIFLEELEVSESFFIPIEAVEFDIRKKEGFLVMSMELYTIEEVTEITERDLNNELMEDLYMDGGL